MRNRLPLLAVLVIVEALFTQTPSRGTPPPERAAKGEQASDMDRAGSGARRPLGPPGDDARPARERLGLLLNDPRAFPGYTLFAPMGSTTTHLIDMEGRVVQTWQSDCPLAASVYLLENGHLLRTGMAGGGPFGRGRQPRVSGGGPPGAGGAPHGLGGGGAGGRVQEFTWDGQLVWDFELATDAQLLHHDIERLPNGNVLMIVWEKKTADEATAAGRNPRLQGNRDLRPDFIVEVKPTGKTAGEIVWEWHIWDHLIQDHDADKANYGDVAAHPERIDVNFTAGWAEQLSEQVANKLRSLGYLDSGPRRGRGPGGPGGPDWTHTNSIAHNAELDQIVLSVHAFHEIWIIDHSTTSAEASGHTGGRSGKGGDLLYRWGNPRAYRAGTRADQQLFAQHDAHWIPPGQPGHGHLLVFNNGRGRPDGNYSSVDEITPPVNEQGQYARTPGRAYGPEKPTWSYAALNKTEFFASHISGAQRLPNGNTLVCSGEQGTLFEVTPQKETVWKYVSPVRGGPGPGGFGFAPPGGNPGRLGGPGRLEDRPQPGESMPAFVQKMREGFGAGGSAGLPGSGRRDRLGRRDGSDGPGSGDRGGPGGPDDGFSPPGRGPSGFGARGRGPGGFGPGGSQLFQALRYSPDYPGLVGKDLTPGKTLADLRAADVDTGAQREQDR